jgi:AraC-like DNA-binding protein
VNYCSTRPTLPLGYFVERFWQISDSPPHGKERIIPSGTIELVINLHENEFRIYDPKQPTCCKRFSGAIVSGAYDGAFVIDAEQHASAIGVHFRPGGAHPFLGVSANELADTHIDLETLRGPSASELRERLCAAQKPSDRFFLLEKALGAHLFRTMEHHYAVGFALSAFGQMHSSLRLREVVQKTGLSQRRFIEVFAREVGMSPKLFCRVRRFQRALDLVRRVVRPNWAQLAGETGFFDQSHLIHDFQHFSGLSPTAYLQQRNERVMQNHVPLASQG